MTESILDGKRILAVDDEEDILAIIREQLPECSITTAKTYESAKEQIERESFDLVILDIMGVRGFDLLNMTTARRIPAVMLTAHAMTPESLQRSIDAGAVSFLPKDELSRLTELIEEIFGELAHGKSHWNKLRGRLGPTFRELWGEMWDTIRFPPDSRISW
jgi:CheY-like chemotaxis protein